MPPKGSLMMTMASGPRPQHWWIWPKTRSYGTHTLMGLLFGYLRQRTGGLAAPILAHMLHNILTVGCTLLWPDFLKQVFD